MRARIQPAFTIFLVAFPSEAPRSGMETLDFGYPRSLASIRRIADKIGGKPYEFTHGNHENANKSKGPGKCTGPLVNRMGLSES